MGVSYGKDMQRRGPSRKHENHKIAIDFLLLTTLRISAFLRLPLNNSLLDTLHRLFGCDSGHSPCI